MNKFFLFLSLTILATSFYSCEEETISTENCNNGIKDGGETEIDCGGPCSTCPTAGTLTCTLGATSYVGVTAAGQNLSPSIRVYARDNNNRTLDFMFVPSALNSELTINDARFSYQGEPYIKAPGDTGHVTITALDTTRKIISGYFGFSARRVTGFTINRATGGVFENIRYK